MMRLSLFLIALSVVFSVSLSLDIHAEDIPLATDENDGIDTIVDDTQLSANALSIFQSISNVSDLPLDMNGRLKSHWLFLNDDNDCKTTVERLWKNNKHKHRSLAAVSPAVIKQFLGDADGAFACTAVCVEKGTHYDYIFNPLKDTAVSFSEQEEGQEGVTKFENWAYKYCQASEMGFVSYHPNILTVYWLSIPDGSRVDVGKIGYGEKYTMWQSTTLGHSFELVDEVTGETVGIYESMYNTVHVIGKQKSTVNPNLDFTGQIEKTLDNEWTRHQRVKRTFTELGFDIGRMPRDLWNSISTYYYNNRHSKSLEEWDHKGLFVNWWESDVYFIAIPWNLKKYWQQRLKQLVEIWSGAELELTDIYGLREYTSGARLLTHVDREQTHAASLIINVAQEGITEPWPIEVYDHSDRLHEVIMNEGDIVYYESAKCLHGRMKPLKGGYYVNLFAHYRPVNDDKWFEKDSPESAPKPLEDVSNATLPYLNPGETLNGSKDLFKYWKKVAEKESTNTRKNDTTKPRPMGSTAMDEL